METVTADSIMNVSSRFRKIFLASSILIMLIGIWILYNQIAIMPAENEIRSTETSHSTISKSIYEQTLPGLDREPMRLEQFKGKTVYIKFWATWCPLCLAGLEDFVALTEQLSSSSDIAMISIVTPGLNGEISKSDFIDWARVQKLSFPIYFDETGALSKEFEIRGYPAAVYLNENGSVMKKTAGDESNAQIMHDLTSIGEK